MLSSKPVRSEAVEDCVFRAQLAEQAERYDDMVAEVRALVFQVENEGAEDITREDRYLLRVAYKNSVAILHSSWRVIICVESKLHPEREEAELLLTRQYRRALEDELRAICGEALRLISDHLVPRSRTSESFVFYQQMTGDFYRHLVDVATGEERVDFVKKCQKAYFRAFQECRETMAATDPTRLNLALFISVFQREIANDPVSAFDTTRRACDEATALIDGYVEDNASLKDSKFIVQLLRDNLRLWSQADNKQGEGRSEIVS